MISLFQKRVYKVVRKIPKGNFLTYKKVAEKAGYPKAWRVVRIPVPILKFRITS